METGTQDYGFRIYNPSLGKFLSVDPLAPEYPWYTPYQFAGNDVIRNIDLDGLEPSNMVDPESGQDSGNSLYNSTNTSKATGASGVTGATKTSSTGATPLVGSGGGTNTMTSGSTTNSSLTGSSSILPEPNPQEPLPFVRPHLSFDASLSVGGAGFKLGQFGGTISIDKKQVGIAYESDESIKSYNTQGGNIKTAQNDGFSLITPKNPKTGIFFGNGVAGLGTEFIRGNPKAGESHQLDVTVGVFEFWSVRGHFDDKGFKNVDIGFDFGAYLGFYVGIEGSAQAGLRIGPR